MWSPLRMLANCVTFLMGYVHCTNFSPTMQFLHTPETHARYSCLSHEMLAINLRFEWNAKHSRPPARADDSSHCLCECVCVCSECFRTAFPLMHYRPVGPILPQRNSLHFTDLLKLVQHWNALLVSTSLWFCFARRQLWMWFDYLSAYSSFMLNAYIFLACLPISRLFWHYCLLTAERQTIQWRMNNNNKKIVLSFRCSMLVSLTLYTLHATRNADCWSEVHGWSSRDRRASSTAIEILYYNSSFVGSSVFAVNSAILWS